MGSPFDDAQSVRDRAQQGHKQGHQHPLELTALGICRPLCGTIDCIACKNPTRDEAGCVCTGCHSHFHVRLMESNLDARLRLPPPKRQLIYTKTCKMCPIRYHDVGNAISAYVLALLD